MGLFENIRGKYGKVSIDAWNKRELAKRDNLFKQFESIVKEMRKILPADAIKLEGATKLFYKEIAYLMPSLECSIYSSVVASFCKTIEDGLQRQQGADDKRKQIESLISKYRERAKSASISQSDYKEFINDLELFSNNYPKWFNDGTRMIKLHNLVEEKINLKLMEKRFQTTKQELEDYLESLHQENQTIRQRKPI